MGVRGNRHFAAQCGVANRRFQYIRYPSINTLRRLWLCEGSLKRKLISTHPPFARTYPAVCCMPITSRSINPSRNVCWLKCFIGWKKQFRQVQSAKLTETDRLRKMRACVFFFRMHPSCRLMRVQTTREHAAGKMCVGINSTRPPQQTNMQMRSFCSRCWCFQIKMCVFNARSRPRAHKQRSPDADTCTNSNVPI